MLLVHEDDQDLILGQAAPLSISTHPTNACCPTRAMPLRPAAPPQRRTLPRLSAACQLLNWFFSDAAVLHSVLVSFQEDACAIFDEIHLLLK